MSIMYTAYFTRFIFFSIPIQIPQELQQHMAGSWIIDTALFCPQISIFNQKALVLAVHLPLFDRHAFNYFSRQITIFYKGNF